MRTATLLLFPIGCGTPTPAQVFDTSLGRDASSVAVDADGRAWSIARPSGGGAELVGIDGTGAFAATTTLSAFVGAPPVPADGGIWIMNSAIFEFTSDGGAIGEHLPYAAARQTNRRSVELWR